MPPTPPPIPSAIAPYLPTPRGGPPPIANTPTPYMALDVDLLQQVMMAKAYHEERTAKLHEKRSSFWERLAAGNWEPAPYISSFAFVFVPADPLAITKNFMGQITPWDPSPTRKDIERTFWGRLTMDRF